MAWVARSPGVIIAQRPDILAAEPAAVVAFSTWDADGA